MIVCLCFGVSDREIRQAIDSGADSVEDLTQGCQAGGGCSGCHPVLHDMLANARARARSGATDIISRDGPLLQPAAKQVD